MEKYKFVFNTDKHSISKKIQLNRLLTYYELEDSITEPFSLDDWKNLIKNYSVSERVNLILRTFGYEPFNLSFMEKIILLIRIIPFCQKSFTFIELGAMSTGKSSTYVKFTKESLCQTGSLTEAKLFGDAKKVNDTTGILNSYKVVVFDEISEGSSISSELATKIRSFLADGNTGRNGANIINSVSTGFVGNLKEDQLKLLNDPNYKTDLFSFFPEAFRQSPFKDRISFVIPGWHLEFEKCHYLKEYSDKVLNINYFMHILNLLREISLEIKTMVNPKDTIRSISHYNATLEGLIKLIYPNEDYTEFELNAMNNISLFGRNLLDNNFKLFNNNVKKFALKFIEEDIINIANRNLSEIDKVFFYENRLHLKFFDEERIYKIPLNRFGRIENKEESEKYYKVDKDSKEYYVPILEIKENYIIQEYSVPYSETNLFNNWKDILTTSFKLNLPQEFQSLESTLNSILKNQENQINSLKRVIEEQSKTIEQLQNEVYTYNDNLESHLRKIKLDLIEHDYLIFKNITGTYPKQNSNFFVSTSKRNTSIKKNLNKFKSDFDKDLRIINYSKDKEELIRELSH